MADLRITDLPALTAALLQASDPIAIADESASETKKISAKDFVQGAVALIDAGSIPSDKVSITIPAGSVGTDELVDNSVTAGKLADSSTATLQAGLPATGAYIGQLTVDTGTNAVSIWDGSAWVAFKAAGSINSITGNAAGVVRLDVTQTGDTAALNTYLADATAARQVLIGPTGGAGAVTLRALIGSDLPLATSTSTGAVQVDGNGLTMAGNLIAIDNAVTPTDGGAVYGVVQYDAYGLVTAGRAIESADLPRAAVGIPGAIQPGTDFAIGVNGTLNHSNAIAPGTATKVTYNASGHITAATSLVSSDIPSLDASKINTGTFSADRIADGSITILKLADYSISYIQEAMPPLTGNHIGTLWYQESTAGLHMFNGNSWMPISIGRLSQENLRYCGTIDATTGLITGVTTFGTAAGYSIGDPLKNATDQLTGTYFVVDVAGSGIPQADVIGVSFDTGDWVLCNGAAAGYVKIDTLNGGGSGVQRLDDLLDVTITTPADGQMFVYNSVGQWVNTSEVVGGTF